MYTIAALYRFTPVADPAALRVRLLPAFQALAIRGTLLIAPEGINGTLAGTAAAIDNMLQQLQSECGLPRADVKFSESEEQPFQRLKIRLKREIITFNQPQADPSQLPGTYVAPQDWNALLADPDVVVLDTRNDYEVKIGTFANAQDPQLTTFTEFADYVRQTLDPQRDKKIAMFCTGGIRCEKASAFMRAEGFAEVYHLQGGILKYLEEIPAEQSRWQGECYVFDRRVSVGHGLVPGENRICFSCGDPLTPQDRLHPQYEPGVSCAACHHTTDTASKARFRMRQHHLSSQSRRQGEINAATANAPRLLG